MRPPRATPSCSRSTPTRCAGIRQTLRVPNQRVEEAARELARRDKVMARMLKRHGVPDLTRAKPSRTHFAELARAICFQQLAGRAAQTIHGRFVALMDGAVSPEAVLALSVDEMRGAGLS